MASAAPAQTRCGVTVCIPSETGFNLDMLCSPCVKSVKTPGCLPFRDRLEVGEPGLEVPANHLVHVDEHVDDFRNERRGSLHGPGDVGRSAVGNEREFDRVLDLERLDH